MRILLADDQPKVRFALRTLLERQPGIEVVGEARNGPDLRGQIEPTRPDLVLLDWELPGESALDTLSNLRTMYPALRVIALSGRPEARQAALRAGVDAFVSKSDPPERLLSAIRVRDQDKDDKRRQSGWGRHNETRRTDNANETS
jgi:DNA-binding NarL/FixJ family response regulator